MALISLSANVNFPPVPREYDADFEQKLVDFLQELSRSVYLKNNHVDVYLPDDSGSRKAYLIVRSPNGTPWALEVDNAGTLTPRDVSAEYPL